jgi:hypothetical protein
MDGVLQKLTGRTWEGTLHGYRVQVFYAGGGGNYCVIDGRGHIKIGPRAALLDEAALRARSWLHANCSNCHVEAGGGNARMELEFTTAADGMRVLGERPMHHTFGLPDDRLIAPGHLERSVLLHRIATRGPGQMPPLSTNRVEAAAVELLRAWIAAMPPAGRP